MSRLRAYPLYIFSVSFVSAGLLFCGSSCADPTPRPHPNHQPDHQHLPTPPPPQAEETESLTETAPVQEAQAQQTDLSPPYPLDALSREVSPKGRVKCPKLPLISYRGDHIKYHSPENLSMMCSQTSASGWRVDGSMTTSIT